MRFAFDALQLAIFTRLNNDSDITQDIFDWPVDPETQTVPYIVIGDFTSEDVSGSTISGHIVSSEVHVYSRSLGMREVNDVMDQVVQSITATPLDISSESFEYLQGKVEAEVRREFDGSEVYRHGIVRFVDTVYEEEIS